MCCSQLCSHCGWLLLKCSAIGIGFNGAETNCRIAHILGILLMNSCNTDRFLATTVVCGLSTLNLVCNAASEFLKGFCSCFFTNTIEIRTELVPDKSMPASCCVMQDCKNCSNPQEGISLHNSPPSGSVLSSWKRFVSPHRKNFNPTGRFVVCSEHITDDCFVGASMKRLVQGAIPSVWKIKLKTIYFLVIVAL